MPHAVHRTICWSPTWNPDHSGIGLEHLLLSDGVADSALLAYDEEHGPFRLNYRLAWDKQWLIREADLTLASHMGARSLRLRADGCGHWQHMDGTPIPALDGCIDIDIWPTPFTNSFPINRVALSVGERRLFRMAWISAPNLSFVAQPQAYTRLADRRYLFENLDGSSFQAELPVDEDGIVMDYPGLFLRI